MDSRVRCSRRDASLAFVQLRHPVTQDADVRHRQAAGERNGSTARLHDAAERERQSRYCSASAHDRLRNRRTLIRPEPRPGRILYLCSVFWPSSIRGLTTPWTYFLHFASCIPLFLCSRKEVLRYLHLKVFQRHILSLSNISSEKESINHSRDISK